MWIRAAIFIRSVCCSLIVDRAHTFRSEGTGEIRSGRNAPNIARERTAAAINHAHDDAERGTHCDCSASPRRTAEAYFTFERGFGLDGDEGAGERPHAPIRNSEWPRDGH